MFMLGWSQHYYYYMNKSKKRFQQIKIFICAIFLMFVSNMIIAQVNTQWVAIYDRLGRFDDRSYSMTYDGPGNIYISGYSQDSNGFFDCSVIKYNSAGVRQWVQHYTGPVPGHDYLSDITTDNNGNVYVTGYSWVDNTARYDCLTLKYNSNGVLQWFARYNGPNLNDEGKSIAVDNNGNVYVTGKSDTISLNSGSFITIKYNSSGIHQWVKRYSGVEGSNNSSVSIALDNAANVYITGYFSFSSNNPDYLTIKYNSSGVEQWAVRYNGTGDSFDLPKCLVLDSAGNIYVTGESSSVNSSDCLTLKYNSGGALLWEARYNGIASNNDGGNSVAVDNSGNVYVAGRTIVSGLEDMLILKYSAGGVQQWVNTYNGTGNGFDEANSVVTDNSGNAYIVGYTKTDNSQNDIVTLKYNSTGSLQWTKNYNGASNGNDYGTGILVDASNDVVITGYIAGTIGATSDIVTIKYSQPVGIATISSEIPEKFSLFQNYPNPFNPSTNIKFDIPNDAKVKITVYDMLGREIYVLVNKELKSGSYSIRFDASALPSGVYFYTLSAGSYSETKKMLLIK